MLRTRSKTSLTFLRRSKKIKACRSSKLFSRITKSRPNTLLLPSLSRRIRVEPKLNQAKRRLSPPPRPSSLSQPHLCRTSMHQTLLPYSRTSSRPLQAKRLPRRALQRQRCKDPSFKSLKLAPMDNSLRQCRCNKMFKTLPVWTDKPCPRTSLQCWAISSSWSSSRYPIQVCLLLQWTSRTSCCSAVEPLRSSHRPLTLWMPTCRSNSPSELLNSISSSPNRSLSSMSCNRWTARPSQWAFSRAGTLKRVTQLVETRAKTTHSTMEAITSCTRRSQENRVPLTTLSGTLTLAEELFRRRSCVYLGLKIWRPRWPKLRSELGLDRRLGCSLQVSFESTEMWCIPVIRLLVK